MLVAHCHEVGCDDAVVSLFESGSGKGSRDEFSTSWIGGRERLVRMKRTTVIFGTAKLVSIRKC